MNTTDWLGVETEWRHALVDPALARCAEGEVTPASEGAAYRAAVAWGRSRLFGVVLGDWDGVLALPIARAAARRLTEGLRRLRLRAEKLPEFWDQANDDIEAREECLSLLEGRMEAWAVFVALDEAELDAVVNSLAGCSELADECRLAQGELAPTDDALLRHKDFLSVAAGTELLANWRRLLVEPYRLSLPWWLDGSLEEMAVRLWKGIPGLRSGSPSLDPEPAKAVAAVLAHEWPDAQAAKEYGRMAAIQVPCFPYRGEDFSAPIALEPGGGPEGLVRCPVRRRLYRLTPEERVRQALIWFLREGADQAAALSQHLRIGVEERSLDAAAFFAGEPLDAHFCPRVTVVIFETKRRERDLADGVEQLKTYMLREGCRSGLLFNGRQALWTSLCGELVRPEWATQWLTDLRQAEERIWQASLEARAHLLDCRAWFDRASAGDFNALSRLASLFGRDRSLVFTVSVRMRGSLHRVQAVAPQGVGPDLVNYWAYGVTSRKRQEIHRRDFHSLMSLLPAGMASDISSYERKAS
jgi:hypothetical protein